MTWHDGVCNAWHRMATPASVTWLWLRSSSVTLHAAVCNAWHRLATPASVTWLSLRSSSVTLHASVCNAWHRLATPVSAILLSLRSSMVTLHATVCNAWHRLATPASVIRLSLRSSSVTLHVGVCNAWHRLATLASVILLPSRDSSITLVNGNDSAIVATHSSAIKQQRNSREVTVQSSFFRNLHICLNPVCVIWQSTRSNTCGAPLDWCEDVWLLSTVPCSHGTTRLKRFGRLPNGLWDRWKVSWFISSFSFAFNVLMTSNRKDTAMQSTSTNDIIWSKWKSCLQNFFTKFRANSLSWYSARHFNISGPTEGIDWDLWMSPLSNLRIKAWSFCFNKMPDINWNTIPEAFSE